MKNSVKIFACTAIMLSFTCAKTQAQVNNQSKLGGDTSTYTIFNNGQNFDKKRTVVIEDKHSVDSLAAILASNDNKQYRIIYHKENQQARVITAKYLKTLNTEDFYRITIAYNKPDEMDEQKPMYIIASK